MKTIKISFRRKKGSRAGTLEVFTSVRLPGVKHPRRKHLCYLPASNAKWEQLDRSKIEAKATAVFRDLELANEIEIDWENAKAKLERVDQPKVLTVDRKDGREQITAWTEDKHRLIPAFANVPSAKSDISGDGFYQIFTKIHETIAEQIPLEDPAEIANWWEDHEAPRLVMRYRDMVLKNHVKGDGPYFNRDGYLEYLGKRYRRFKITDFMRWKQSSRRHEDAS